MFAVSLDLELQNEANVTPTNAYERLARLSFHTRRELVEAARVSNPGNPLAYLTANYGTVATTARGRASSNVR